MSHHCEHSGFHSGMGKLAADAPSIRFVLICDDCGEETREVHVEAYSPVYEPGANGSSGDGHAGATSS